MSENQKSVSTIPVQKSDGSVIETAYTSGDSMKSVLERAQVLNPASFTYLISGPGIEGGQKQVEESLLEDVKVDSEDQILVIPKTIAGF